MWSINATCRIETAPHAGLDGRHPEDQNGAGYRLTVSEGRCSRCNNLFLDVGAGLWLPDERGHAEGCGRERDQHEYRRGH